MTKSKPILGLVGGIGAGKSTAAKLLESHGGFVIDADSIGHEVLDRPEIQAQIAARWGNVVRSDQRIDRRKLARIVFGSPEERRKLEEIVFPYIRQACEDRIHAAMTDVTTKFVVLDAAVLLEAGWSGICDRILYIEAPRELRLSRLKSRSGWSADDLDARESAQWTAEKKKQWTNAVVCNDGSRDELEAKLVTLLQQWNMTV